jgi:hypothetical protein
MQITWEKPRLTSVIYFNSVTVQKYFRANGLEYSRSKAQDLEKFLSTGKFDYITVSELKKNSHNLPLTEPTFRKEFRLAEYADTFSELFYDLVQSNTKIVLSAPIIIKFGSTYNGYSGIQGLNLAVENNMRIKVWLVTHSK